MPRKSKLDLQQILIRVNRGESIRSIAKSIGVNHNTIRHLLKVNNCKRTVTYDCAKPSTPNLEEKTA